MKKYLSYLLVVVILILHTNLMGDGSNEITINYNERLEFYLDLKTKRFLQKMSVKEAFLLQFIQNISDELKSRGKKRLSEDDVGFNIIYKESNKLISDYSQEMNKIINIVHELGNLELVLRKSNDLKLLNDVDELKDKLISVLEDRKTTQYKMSKKDVSALIDEYSGEVDALLKIYEEMSAFEKKAQYMGDIEVVKQLQKQQKRILTVIEMSRIAGPKSDDAVESYIDETTKLIGILKELEKMETISLDDTVNIVSDIELVRDDVISKIDDRVLSLFGYASGYNKVTVSEYFNEWKARKLADYQIKLTEYKIVKKQLVSTAHPQERDRMLEHELQSALLDYTDNNHELTLLQFDDILNVYGSYYPQLDAVLYYRNESNYALGYYDDAFDGYNKLIEKYPNSLYSAKSYFKLMHICYTYNWNGKFFQYYENLQAASGLPLELQEEAHYLAGFLYFNQKEYYKSEKILEKLSLNSEYYLPAQYLLGVVYFNKANYSKGKLIFEKIIENKTFSQFNINLMVIRNEALLKLGYLHYQRSEFTKAIKYFEQVTQGYKGYDSSLMGQAWSNLKKGRYDTTIGKIDVLTNNYIESQFTYEGLVLSAHCKKIQKNVDDALQDLYFVANSKRVMDKADNYNEERKHVLAQLSEVGRLEGRILERQDQHLFPKVMNIRNIINNALISYYYRGSISNRIYEEFNDERRVLINQIEEFENILKFAEENKNYVMAKKAKLQRNRLLLLLDSYPVDKFSSDVNYFIDYPLATKESGIIYRQDIIKKVSTDLLTEKRRIKSDLDMITRLMSSNNSETRMDIVIDLEILEEDLKDLRNQLNKFQVWLANHKISDINTDADYWADFSGFGISDINFSNYYERKQKINTLSKNIAHINNMLMNKKNQLENKIKTFNTQTNQINKELSAEKIRLQKLEKEKYFRDLYFETKTKEAIADTAESIE